MPGRTVLILAHLLFFAILPSGANADAASSLQELRAGIDGATFEPDQKIMSLGFEAEPIIDFVSRDVGYVSYSGSLKGINGTLQSLRGNALDQSLLLANLLKQAGFDARIARSSLSETDQQKLVLQIAKLDPTPYTVDESVVRNSATYDRFSRALSQLASAREMLPRPKSQLSLLQAEAGDYFWVQYDAGSGWQDAHPAFGELSPPTLEPIEYFADTIPDSLLQTVSLQVFAQRREAGEVIVEPITEAWQRPTGNLLGEVVTFALVPLGLNEQTATDLDGHLARTQFFAPMLNGSPAGNWVIDENGRRIDSLAANSAGAGIFKTLADKTEEAIVGVAPELDGSFALERVWFEIVLSAPGMPDRTLTRTIYDEKYDAGADVPNAPLFATYHFAFDVGSLSSDYLVSQFIDTLSVSNSWLQAMLARIVENDSDAHFPDEEISRSFSLFSQQTLQNAHTKPGVVRYRSEPGILAVRESYRGAGRYRISTDIVNNRQRFLRYEQSDLLSAPDAALVHGVWETATEWLPRQLSNNPDSSSLNTIDYLAQLIANGDELRLLDVSVPGLPKAAMADLADGYVLLIPGKVAAPDMNAYWRIEPQSGETLGMLSDGRGSDLTEYLAQLVGISLTLVKALSNLAECQSNGGNLAEQACCIMNAHANTAYDMSYGNVIGALFGESIAVFDDIVVSDMQDALGDQSVNLMDCGNMQNYGTF